MIVVDYRFHYLDSVKQFLSLVAYPVQWFADSPLRLVDFLGQSAFSYNSLNAENKKLKEEKFLQDARLQKLLALESENKRLRELLQSYPEARQQFTVAEIMKVSTDPFTQRVILNKGFKDGVLLGQAVIDANGVVGEVIEVNPHSSHVILLTDASYGIPIENVRNGVRGIAMGTGTQGNLELKHIANTVDLEMGDVLVTSGLDGHYPSGYPVGSVSHIEHDPGESFAVVRIVPSARLDRIREVLLLDLPKAKD